MWLWVIILSIFSPDSDSLNNCAHLIYFDMSCISEAQIRFLKAKLRVMQEEMDRLGQECNKKVTKFHIKRILGILSSVGTL